MPQGAVKTKKDEELWSRAKARAAEQGHSEEWDYVMSIYQSMKGKKKESSMNSKDLLKAAFVKEAITADSKLWDVLAPLANPIGSPVIGGIRGAEHGEIGPGILRGLGGGLGGGLVGTAAGSAGGGLLGAILGGLGGDIERSGSMSALGTLLGGTLGGLGGSSIGTRLATKKYIGDKEKPKTDSVKSEEKDKED